MHESHASTVPCFGSVTITQVTILLLCISRPQQCSYSIRRVVPSAAGWPHVVVRSRCPGQVHARVVNAKWRVHAPTEIAKVNARAKPLIMSGHFWLSRLFPTKEPLMIERFGFERHRFRYRSCPQGNLQPTSKIQHPRSALDLSLWSYVIVVSIQYETSIQSFFLRVRKEGV